MNVWKLNEEPATRFAVSNEEGEVALDMAKIAEDTTDADYILWGRQPRVIFAIPVRLHVHDDECGRA